MKRVLSVILLIGIFILSACESKQTKDFIFEGKYPPLGDVVYIVNGKAYKITAFEGQCVLFFNDNISQSQAEVIVKEYGGKIVEQKPAYNYYLVEVAAGNESEFVARMRERDDVIYSFLNTPCVIASQIYILDNFNKPVKNDTSLVSHGKKVQRTFLKYGMGSSMHLVNIGLGEDGISASKADEAIKHIIASNMPMHELLDVVTQNINIDDIVLINMSYGPELKGGGYYFNAPKDYQDEYKIRYAEGMKALAVCFSKMREKGFSNFIVTKASGNEGYHDLDEVLNDLDDWTKNSLKKNMVLVNAFDNKRKDWYSNLPGRKHELSTTIDISQEYLLNGTSFAAPKLLGFIDKLMTDFKILNAQDMLQAIRNATPENPREPMTYEKLEREVKKLSKKECNLFSFILDMTSDYSGEWDLSEGQQKDVVKYQVHDTYSYEYLSRQKSAIDIENCTDYDMEIFLNAIETKGITHPMRYYLSCGERQSFSVYNHETMELVSVNKFEVRITTW